MHPVCSEFVLFANDMLPLVSAFHNTVVRVIACIGVINNLFLCGYAIVFQYMGFVG